MAVTVEDGTQVSGSDSYVTRAEYIAYALTLGTVIADNTTADNQLVKAAIYIDTKEGRLIGQRVTRDQSMAYPRSYLYIDDFEWLNTEIPTQVKQLQYNLALDINDGIDLYNRPQQNSVVKRKKLDDVVEVEYAVSETIQMQRQSATNSLLASLSMNSGLSIPIVMS